MKKAQYLGLLSAAILFGSTFTAKADLFKWINNEAIPTVTGERPLKIKPYVKFSHGDAKFQLGQDNLYINIGGVTIQTHQLKKRLVQAGCVIETGNVAACAPDVLARELQNIANSAAASTAQEQEQTYWSGGNGAAPYSRQYLPPTPIAPMRPMVNQTPPLYCCDPATGMKVCQIALVAGPVGSPCQCVGVMGAGFNCY